MKYSVLMSIYKNDNPYFLKIALESIYDKQTRKPDEIVVVFDGKLTECLYEVLNNFKEGKEDIVFYYPQETNQGLGQSLKIGTEKCTGDYIFRMDADDISVPDRFEKQIDYIEKHPEIDVLGANISEFYSSPENEKMRVRVCPKKHNDIVRMAKKRNPMNHVTVCIKKATLLKVGGYETMLLMEDYYLWIKIIVFGFRLENMNESLVYVRIGNGFEKRRGQKSQISSWRKLQRYMLTNKIIGVMQATFNMINIIAYVYCPNFIRNFAYEKLLRKCDKQKSNLSKKPFENTNLCPKCETGKKMLALDDKEPMCPYISQYNNKNCTMYMPINKGKVN